MDTGAFAIPDLDREIKWHCRYARQNGIHVSPTFMVDGMVRPDMGSGDAVEVVVFHAIGRKAILCAAQQLHRAVGADLFGVREQMQELAAQLLARHGHASRRVGRLAHHDRPPDELTARMKADFETIGKLFRALGVKLD